MLQCVPQQYDYEKFVKLKSGDNKHLVCTVYPVDGDTDLSHYEISGVVLQGGVEKGILKVASEKKGSRLNYDIFLEPDKNICLSKVYTSSQGFKNGKSCQFRLFFDETSSTSRFVLKDGKLQSCSKDEKMEVDSKDKTIVSIFVRHCNEGKEQKTSAEVEINFDK